MDTSFLFSGINFNKKKFAADFSKFQTKKPEETVNRTEPEVPERIKEESNAQRKAKKRKRSIRTDETSAGFNLFQPPSYDLEKSNSRKKAQAISEKKEHFRNQELAISLRKKYGIHVAGESVPAPLQQFNDLASRYGCGSYLLKNLSQFGFDEPTPIQRQAIPVLLSGRGCLACAPTGSGKTFAFLIPVLIKLKAASKDGIRAIILCPTRELAAQTTRECKKLVVGKKFRVRLMTKKLSRSADLKQLPIDILVSTPLRLDFALKKKLDLSSVEYLILDESDKLFEREGFLEQIDPIVSACSNPSLVCSLFSATLPETVEELARSIIHDAVRIIIGKKNSASELVNQKLKFVGNEEGKLLAVYQLFETSLKSPILMFVQTKERAKELFRELFGQNFKVDCIHADLTQAQRDAAVDKFREGKTWVLIATDVIARGMDFKGVNTVINYDFPESAAAYIHRIGRCGRAGRTGEAITLFTEEDVQFLRNIANVMTASGCEVPSWILSLPKLKKKKHRPVRDCISTDPKTIVKRMVK